MEAVLAFALFVSFLFPFPDVEYLLNIIEQWWDVLVQ